jgi:hypothetical protein
MRLPAYFMCACVCAPAPIRRPGSFVLRPKGNHLDLVLTVRTSELAGPFIGMAVVHVHHGLCAPQRPSGLGPAPHVAPSALGDSQETTEVDTHTHTQTNKQTNLTPTGPRGVRHFVVRVIPPSTPAGPPAYRCGSVGPYTDLQVGACARVRVGVWA